MLYYQSWGAPPYQTPEACAAYLPFSQVSEFEMGGVQEFPLHVYLDGPATTEPLGQVSSMDSPILYNLLYGLNVRSSGTTGLRHSVPAGRAILQMCFVEQNTQQVGRFYATQEAILMRCTAVIQLWGLLLIRKPGG